LPLLGSASGTSTTNPSKNNPPTPYQVDGAASADPSSPVYFTHIAEHKSQKQRLEQYESSGEPAILYHHVLQRELAENPGKSTFNLVVNTMGERTSMARNDRHNRTLHGFKLSFGLNSWSNCPSDYCEELDSCTSGGGVPVAAVGNKDNDSKVE
jgi:hypothetical protein